PVGDTGPPSPVCVPRNTPNAATLLRASSTANDRTSAAPSGRIDIRPFIHSVYASRVVTSARASVWAAKVAPGWHYGSPPAQPFPVSHASKNCSAVSFIELIVDCERFDARTAANYARFTVAG